jgi:2-polyprenyl-3-methyl-5-hydroxy-6-metoxy-1,4-benzoquinol methylase
MLDRTDYPYFEDVNVGLLRMWGSRRGLRVLDVGCGAATTSREIAKRGNEVIGIDSAPGAIAIAEDRLSRAICADILDFDAIEAELGDKTFDAIILADELEHLPWPLDLLRGYMRFLAPGGRVLVSLPNVGLWSVRFSLLAGRFQYEDTGVLDRTHLRFFTRSSARRTLEAAGLEVLRTTYNPGLVRPFVPLAKSVLGRGSGGGPAALLESAPYRFYLKLVYPIERLVASLWPGLLAFQMIFETRLKESR